MGGSFPSLCDLRAIPDDQGCIRPGRVACVCKKKASILDGSWYDLNRLLTITRSPRSRLSQLSVLWLTRHQCGAGATLVRPASLESGQTTVPSRLGQDLVSLRYAAGRRPCKDVGHSKHLNVRPTPHTRSRRGPGWT
jgi:hypothetical protein